MQFLVMINFLINSIFTSNFLTFQDFCLFFVFPDFPDIVATLSLGESNLLVYYGTDQFFRPPTHCICIIKRTQIVASTRVNPDGNLQEWIGKHTRKLLKTQ